MGLFGQFNDPVDPVNVSVKSIESVDEALGPFDHNRNHEAKVGNRGVSLQNILLFQRFQARDEHVTDHFNELAYSFSVIGHWEIVSSEA